MPAGACHRAALRADPLAGMTHEEKHASAFSRRVLARALHHHQPLEKSEGAGKTGCWPHPWPPREKVRGALTTGTAETSGGFNRLSQHCLIWRLR